MQAVTSIELKRFGFEPATLAAEDRAIPVERPVAFEINGLGYAVMMASPQDIEDFAHGFLHAEGLASGAADIVSVDIAQIENGHIVRVDLSGPHANDLHDRIRLRLTEGSCGLCGLQSIEAALRPLPRLSAAPAIDGGAVEAALSALGSHQPLGRQTGAMHAAAFCDGDGRIVALREDVGRHNALDKLAGHLLRTGRDAGEGFILLSARCSYELVEKTVRLGCPALVTISAPTSLAVERAQQSNLTLIALARRDSALVLNDPHGRFEPRPSATLAG